MYLALDMIYNTILNTSFIYFHERNKVDELRADLERKNRDFFLSIRLSKACNKFLFISLPSKGTLFKAKKK